MISDLSESSARALPEFDLCIVGTGPASATVASELADSGLRICVLESGRRKPTRHGDSLRAVRSEGLFIKDYSRERVLGGTSTTWAGLSSPLDELDLAPRPWLRFSGWPIERAELLPFYGRAAERYRFAPLSHFESDDFEAIRAGGDVQPTWERVQEKVFLACSDPQNFGKECRDVWEGDAVQVYLDATVQRFEGTADRVECAVVRSSDGSEHRVRARAFVIGTGGIENARLLLLSDAPWEGGLGNAHGQVGRYFMNHPKNYYGTFRLERTVKDLPYYFGCLYGGYAGYAGLRLLDEHQRERGLLNSYVRFEPLFPWSDNDGVESLVLFVKRAQFFFKRWKDKREGEVVSIRDYSETGDDSDLQNERKGFLDWIGLAWNVVRHARSVAHYAYYRVVDQKKPVIRRVRLRNFLEMEPDPDNRVVLGDERDPFGQPLPLVKSRLTDLDKRSLVELHEVLAAELEREGLGRLEADLANEATWPIDLDASHHLGTTRMGDDPRTSVVDATQRIHGIENTYMAGGSVFPTSGCANPTFTIVALSIRLADHLRAELLASASEAPS